MLTKSTRAAHQAIDAIRDDILPQAQARGRALAADALPILADAAEQAGEFIGRATSAASDFAAKQLRTVQSAKAADNVAALGSVLAPALFFAKRRPMVAFLGGLVIAGVGVGLWRHMQSRNAETPAPEADA